MAEKRARAFAEPMLLLRTEKLPEGKDWLYELKFDGYRALAIKSGTRSARGGTEIQTEMISRGGFR